MVNFSYIFDINNRLSRIVRHKPESIELIYDRLHTQVLRLIIKFTNIAIVLLS